MGISENILFNRMIQACTIINRQKKYVNFITYVEKNQINGDTSQIYYFHLTMKCLEKYLRKDTGMDTLGTCMYIHDNMHRHLQEHWSAQANPPLTRHQRKYMVFFIRTYKLPSPHQKNYLVQQKNFISFPLFPFIWQTCYFYN